MSTWAAARRGPHRETKLQKFLVRRGIASARVEAKLRERLGGRAPSSRQFGRWRLGRSEIRRKDMARILWAVREVANDPAVLIDDLFDLNPDSEEIWQD